MDHSDSRSTYSASQSKPIHIEIRPRDTYQEHVKVEKGGSIISWSFFTRRKNIAFGLFYLYNTRKTESSQWTGEASPTTAGSTLLSSSVIREAISASRKELHINPPSSPKPGHGSASVPSSRANSVLPVAGVEDNYLPSVPTADNNSFNEQGDNGLSSNVSLSRSKTFDVKDMRKSNASERIGEGRSSLDKMSRLNSSLPDLRPSPPPASTDIRGSLSMSAPNSMEFVEVIPIERYESFEHTIYGHYIAPLEGTYVLYFDNSYSINTSKELFLTVWVGDSIPPTQDICCGWLFKKKQRKLQGWARRWFQLDRRGILSYYEDRFSSCRGSIDLHHCTITKVPNRWAFTIDSGQVTFHLRAITEEDYVTWSEHFSSLIVNDQAMQHLNRSVDEIIISQTRLEVQDYSEKLLQKLQESEQNIAKLHEMAKMVDGSIKFIPPLEKAMGSLNELYQSLSEYAIYLQRKSRTFTGAASSSVHHSSIFDLNSPRPASVDEFFDAEEIIVTELSSEDEEEENFTEAEEEEYLVSSTAPSESEFTTSTAAMTTSLTTMNYRSRMPRVAPPCNVSISSLLRKSIGKDWTSMPMPVALNEPLSALQRMCEELEYSHLLDEAASMSDPINRLIKVTAFAISAYASTVHRIERKPFTPILGETFEYERIDLGYRFLAEKICHRPLILACHAESQKGWSFWQDQRMKSKFWGKSMEYMPEGTLHVLFPDTGDHFVWRKVVSCVRNLIMGTKFIEHYGEMQIKNVKTGDCAVVNFKPNASSGFFSSSKGSNEVQVSISRPNAGPIQLRGRWDSMLMAAFDGVEQVVWKAAPVPNDHVEYFGFSQFAISLNDLPNWLHPKLPPTDSRLRPDQRMLEVGRVEEAEETKQKVEQMQRDHRQRLEEQEMEWNPLWFKFIPNEDNSDLEGSWVIRDPNAYWESREQQRWPTIHPLW